jgi:hypothetical protein
MSFFISSILYIVTVHYTAHTFGDVRFTQQWISRLQASGMLHCVGWLMGNNFLEDFFPPSSGQMTEGVGSFKMFVLACQTTQDQISKEHLISMPLWTEHLWWTYCWCNANGIVNFISEILNYVCITISAQKKVWYMSLLPLVPYARFIFQDLSSCPYLILIYTHTYCMPLKVQIQYEGI